jgi:hypothetical protein
MIGCAYNAQKMEVSVIEDGGIIRKISDGKGGWSVEAGSVGFIGN